MRRVIPALRTTDYDRSEAFYIDGLGFRVDSEHRFEPDFPVFATLIRISAVQAGGSLPYGYKSSKCQAGKPDLRL